jgi:hypothetical protein
MKHRQLKREEAEARQEKYDALSTAQKLKLASSRRGQSKRECAKLKGQRNGITSDKAVQKD